jgi:hypothetical protein
MSARNRLAAGAFLAALAVLPAHAQSVSSSPLAKVDPWAVGWLGKADGALPAEFWENTDGKTLKPVFEGIKAAELSPAGRRVLGRILLSSAKPPTSGAALIPERLRLIEELGETEASLDLRGKFPDQAWGKPADRLKSDYELLTNRAQPACMRVADKKPDDPEWLPVRALCYAVAKDFNAAGMVAEQVETSPGQVNVWLLSAIEYMRAPTNAKPEGRYGTMFEAAVSTQAGLSVPRNAMNQMPADWAVALVRNPKATPEQKATAMRIAARAGKLEADDVAGVVEAMAADTAPRARPAGPDFLAMALKAAADDKQKPASRATSYAAALKNADNAADFRIAAVALAGDVKKLEKGADTRPHAETFARAALSLGDTKEAAAWRTLLAGDKAADAWMLARLDAMLGIAGDGAKAGQALEAMLDALPAPAPAAAKEAKTAPSKQEELRRIENTRALFLHVGLGRKMTAEQRATFGGQRSAGRGILDSNILRMQAALDAGAKGEAALVGAGQLGPDSSAISFAGLADLLVLLREAGFEKEAAGIALEAMQPWKAL